MRKTNLKTKYDSRIIESKFGPIKVSESSEVSFPIGILGMPKCKRFHIIPCHVEKFSQFLLMQSADDDNLIFMVLPVDLANPKYHQEEDIIEACNQVGVAKEEASFVLIASTKINEDGKKLITVNTRAPIVIDVKNRVGVQYVLQNNEYDVQRFL
jgi:flagellar assembly factor FliW